MAKKEIFRVVTRAQDGSLRIRDFHSAENILATHSQVGTDDSSTDLDLRGMPVFRGLVGPIPEGKNIVRYESPEVLRPLPKNGHRRKHAVDVAVQLAKCNQRPHRIGPRLPIFTLS